MTNEKNLESTEENIPKFVNSIKRNLKKIIDAKTENSFQISEKNKNLFSKIGTYSVNILGEVLSNYYKLTPTIGNGYGATIFSTLDVLAGNKNNKFQRLTKSAGFVWYVGECVYDIVSVLNGEYNSLANFPLDVSMAWHLGAEQRKLYTKAGKKEDDTAYSLRKDLEEILKYFMPKEDSTKIQDLEKKTSDKKNYFQGIKDYFSNVFILKDTLSNEEKARANFLSDKRVSLKDKKQFLYHYGEDATFMKNYEIENKYSELKQKPIDEQIKTMQDKKSSLEKTLVQRKNASLFKKIWESGYISDIKSELKKVNEILWELDIEKKNPKSKFDI